MTIIGGQEAHVIADLVPDRRDLPDLDPVAALPPTATAGEGRGLTPDLGRDRRDSPEPAPASARFSALTRPLAWTASALASGALAFAAYESVKWNRELSEFNNHMSTPVASEPSRRDCGADDEGRGGLSCDAIYRDMERAKTLALLGYAAGALLAGGAVTLFMISPWSDDADSMVRIACAPASSLSGGTCRFTF